MSETIAPIERMKERAVMALGHKRWTVSDGYIPSGNPRSNMQPTAGETASILNPEDCDAQVRIMVYFADREPAGPYELSVPAQRTKLVEFRELNDPEPIPKETPFTSVVVSDVPVVVQQFRQDSDPTETALVSTLASPFPEPETHAPV